MEMQTSPWTSPIQNNCLDRPSKGNFSQPSVSRVSLDNYKFGSSEVHQILFQTYLAEYFTIVFFLLIKCFLFLETLVSSFEYKVCIICIKHLPLHSFELETKYCSSYVDVQILVSCIYQIINLIYFDFKMQLKPFSFSTY